MTDVVVEWVAFSLQPGVTEATLQARSDAMQREFLSQCDGYRSRDLLKLDDSQYADCVIWESKAKADAAMANAAEHASCAEYFALLEVSAAPMVGVPLRRYDEFAALAEVGGIEFSPFKPLPGASDASIASAAVRMADALYADEPGFVAHWVVKSDSGQYADVVLASSATRATELCGKWGPPPHEPSCRDYLAAIDPTSVQLGFYERVR
jgi:hypothetical protein